MLYVGSLKKNVALWRPSLICTPKVCSPLNGSNQSAKGAVFGGICTVHIAWDEGGTTPVLFWVFCCKVAFPSFFMTIFTYVEPRHMSSILSYVVRLAFSGCSRGTKSILSWSIAFQFSASNEVQATKQLVKDLLNTWKSSRFQVRGFQWLQCFRSGTSISRASVSGNGYSNTKVEDLGLMVSYAGVIDLCQAYLWWYSTSLNSLMFVWQTNPAKRGCLIDVVIDTVDNDWSVFWDRWCYIRMSTEQINDYDTFIEDDINM